MAAAMLTSSVAGAHIPLVWIIASVTCPTKLLYPLNIVDAVRAAIHCRSRVLMPSSMRAVAALSIIGVWLL